MKFGDTITLEELKKNKDNRKFISNYFIDLEQYFEKFETVIIDDKINMFLNGVKININKPNGIYKIIRNNIIIGTGIVENNKLKRDIIIKED